MKVLIKKRLSDKKGFTLAETLMAILILLMVTAVVAGGIPVAVNAYNKVVLASNAQLLLSTTMTRLRDELGTATQITVEENEIKYVNDKGVGNKISLTDKEGVYLEENYTASTDDKKYKHLLVTEQAATESLYMTYTVNSYTGGVLTLGNLKVKSKSDDKILVEIPSFQIKILTDLT